MRLLISILLLTLLAAFGLVAFSVLFTIPEHEFVSADGGFVMESGFKHPMAHVENSFERYRFLRNNPKMPLYRTTELKLSEAFSREAKFEYNPTIKKIPVDWWLELQGKCIKEYIPRLPTALEREDVRLFFFNQYDDMAIEIYGFSKGKVFGLTIRNNPANAASGKVWESPVWCYTKGIDIQEDHWRDLWQFVNQNKEDLIAEWEVNRKSLTEKFEREYDGLF